MSIDVTYGPMFAGKSTSLLEKVEKLELLKTECLVVKHSEDTRSEGVVESHDGKKHKAVMVTHLMDLFGDSIEINKINKIDYVAIDEGQFFEDLLEFCIAAKKLGKYVIVAGLDLKFNKEPFGDILKLVEVADIKTHLLAVCQCGKSAQYSNLNKKMVNNLSEKIIIGGSEKYTAVCSECYDVLNK
jgi:thymidine kinase